MVFIFLAYFTLYNVYVVKAFDQIGGIIRKSIYKKGNRAF